MNSNELENELRTKWLTSADFYAPLRLSDVAFNQNLEGDQVLDEIDVSFELRWGEGTVRFIAEVKAGVTPRSSQRTLEKVRKQAAQLNGSVMPALVTTYLSPGIVEQLEETGVSGLDLSGNYYIQTPYFVALRLDRKNEYPESRDIKAIFSHNSSIVSRFLLKENRNFEQVNEIYEGVLKHGGGISLSTVSKVLKGLEDELIIEKSAGIIRVLQPAKMLEGLKDGYRNPRVSSTLKLKLPDDRQDKDKKLNDILGEGRWIWSGESSAEHYAATTPTPIPMAYTPEGFSMMNMLREYEDKRFYNCIVKQSEDAFVYFDRNDYWASKIETYLALSKLDKREREIAHDIGHEILAEFDDHV